MVYDLQESGECHRDDLELKDLQMRQISPEQAPRSHGIVSGDNNPARSYCTRPRPSYLHEACVLSFGLCGLQLELGSDRVRTLQIHTHDEHAIFESDLTETIAAGYRLYLHGRPSCINLKQSGLREIYGMASAT